MEVGKPSRRLTTIYYRSMASSEDNAIARIAWKTWNTSTTVYGNLLEEMREGVRGSDLIYRPNKFCTSRCFLGNDGREYCWKLILKGFVLTSSDTGEEVARFERDAKGRGIFTGQRKSCLTFQDSRTITIDRDLVLLSFLILEKKRLDHARDGTSWGLRDEDPVDGGGFEATGDVRRNYPSKPNILV